MRPLLALSLLACGLTGVRADDPRPAASNVPFAEYPRIHPDRRVSFRLRAPDAKGVKVQPGGTDNGLGKGPYEMERADDGIWTVTIPPAVPGFHYYWLVVDGVQVNDPGSETFFGYGKPTSGVEIPEPGVDFYDIKDVPHGEVRSLWYHSKITGKPRRATVYTPPDYDADARRLSGALPPARCRRGRAGLDNPGPGELHPRQPHRHREGGADDRGHGQWICHEARRGPRRARAAGRGRGWPTSRVSRRYSSAS